MVSYSQSDPGSGDLGLFLSSCSSSSHLHSPTLVQTTPPPPHVAQSPPQPTLPEQPRPTHTKRQTLTRKISFPDHQLDPALLDRLKRWIITFAIVEFDIDAGPNLDNCFPPVRFPLDVKSNIAFSSLPEGDLPAFSPVASTSATIPTSSTSRHEPQGYAYHWRIPYPSEGELRKAEAAKGKEVLRLPEGEDGDGALHGYVWFVQEKEERSRRGYSQTSLVLITHLPSLPGLFTSLLALLGPLHFKHARDRGTKGGMVESACYNISAWPDPTSGQTLDLPFLGSVLTVSLPLPSQTQFPVLPFTSLSSTSSTNSPSRAPRRAATYPYFPPSPFLSSSTWTPPNPASSPPSLPASLPLTPLCVLLFPPYVSASTPGAGAKIGPIGFTKLLLLWELIVLGEPVLVFSQAPKEAAETVEHLKRLIKPIPFAGDIRPYFHVHDRDFASICKAGKKPASGTLLGSTNPLILSHSKTWPHVLNLSRSPSSASPSTSSTSSLARSGSVRKPPDAQAGGGEKAFGLRSERKRHVRKDEKVARGVEEAWMRGDYAACDLLLYQHFASLTERFLAPLNRYFGTLWAGSGGLADVPSGSNGSTAPPPLLSPGPSPLPSTRFSPSTFLTSLKTHGSSLPLKPSPSFSTPSSTPIERFYARFLRPEHGNPHAQAWERERTRALGGEVRKRYLRRLEEVDFEEWAAGKGEKEVREMVGRLEREAGRLSLQSASSSPTSTSTPPTPAFNAGLGISSPSAGSTLPLTSDPSSFLQPGSRLLKQAERLRELRDERTRSIGGKSVGSVGCEGWDAGSNGDLVGGSTGRGEE
ncbi:hypothetical protein JCM11641_006725 [Rhodosporidiobolus odoratus]